MKRLLVVASLALALSPIPASCSLFFSHDYSFRAYVSEQKVPESMICTPNMDMTACLETGKTPTYDQKWLWNAYPQWVICSEKTGSYSSYCAHDK